MSETVCLNLSGEEVTVVIRALDRLGTPTATAMLLRLGAEVGNVEENHSETRRADKASAFGLPVVICGGTNEQ